ncbi:MAG: hypothetical protein ACR2PI_21020 [Hyphomicrobiaceae bacterium]
MLIPTTMIALLIAAMAYSLFPHWSAYFLAALTSIPIYAAYRTLKADRQRKRASKQHACHRKVIDNGYIRDSARTSSLVGDETIDTGNCGD